VWNLARTAERVQLIKYLQDRGSTPPEFWLDLASSDKRSVVRHLCAVGNVKIELHSRVRDIVGSDALQPYRDFREYTNLRDKPRDTERPMLYPKPNEGRRILPPIYTRLTDLWLKASRVHMDPAKMNQGHLKCTVDLLNESHVNLVDRMIEVLGRMHRHLDNRPDLQSKLEDLFFEFEALEVDELYPVVVVVASHIEPELCINPDGQWLDDDNYPF